MKCSVAFMFFLTLVLLVVSCGKDDAPDIKSGIQISDKEDKQDNTTSVETKKIKEADNEKIEEPKIKPIQTEQILREFILTEAFQPDNPWLVAQGIKALGLIKKIPNEQDVIEYLLEHIEQVNIKGKQYFRFKEGEYYNSLTDANPNVILKILADKSADRHKQYKTKFGVVTLNMLIHDAKMLLITKDFTKSEYPNFDWSIGLLVNEISLERSNWTNAYGEYVDFKELIKLNFSVLKEHMQNIEKHYDNNMRRIKTTGAIHSDIDGGAHLFKSSAKAIYEGFGDKDMLNDLRKQAELVLYRLKYEPFMYEAMHKDTQKEDISDSERRIRLWAFYRDMLKFYAYQLESAQLIQKYSLISIDEPRRKIIDNARENLQKLIFLMFADGTFKWIHQWNKKPEKDTSKKHIVYHDIVADSCQAYKVLFSNK